MFLFFSRAQADRDSGWKIRLSSQIPKHHGGLMIWRLCNVFFCVCVFPHIFQYSHLFVEILENRMLNLKLIQMASGYPWDIEEHPEELVFFFHGFFWW